MRKKPIIDGVLKDTENTYSLPKQYVDVICSYTEIKLSRCRSTSFPCKAYVLYVSLKIEVIEPFVRNKR